MHNDQPLASVARSLEASEAILPHVSYLLQDLWALGSSVDQIVSAIKTLTLDAGSTRVLDLGCGKGAISVTVAGRFGFRVTGIDAMAEFIDIARGKAWEHQLTDLCDFHLDDVLEYTREEHEFDLVILASMGGIFGDLKETIKILRTQVPAGGFILIDDGYLKNRDSMSAEGYRHYRNHAASVKELTSLGDRMVLEIPTTGANKEINDEYLRHMKRRTAELVDRHPELKHDLHEYLSRQERECQIIEAELAGMVWLLRKAAI